jgi:hypothetical protein
MKKTGGIKNWIILAFALAFHSMGASADIVCSTSVGDEGAIVISWASESNAVYKIEYASYVSNSVSTTPWQTLCENYPSHGTNTFWMDSGNYALDPIVKRPKDNPFRFYRVSKTATYLEIPSFIQIISPANNDVLSHQCTVSVVATSTWPVISHRLYLDGLEMPSNEDGTNYIINTCEWANGPHVLFAVADIYSGASGYPDAEPVTNSYCVSSYVPVIFNNYISQLYFSEPAFKRSGGPTQTVTAVFSAYASWTIDVVDDQSNVVQTATGEGWKMSYGWDGNDSNGNAVPPGDYFFEVSAEPADEFPVSPPPSTDPGPMPLPGAQNALVSYPTTMQEALSAGSTSYFIPHPPMPPLQLGDGSWCSWEEAHGVIPPIEVEIPLNAQQSFLQSLTQRRTVAVLSPVRLMSTTSSPTKDKGPSRPPVTGSMGSRGVFGVAYFTYPDRPTYLNPWNGRFPPYGSLISFGGISGYSTTLPPTSEMSLTADGFAGTLKNAGWTQGFNKKNGEITFWDLARSDLYGGSNLFNQVDLGLFMAHGNYGTTLDYHRSASNSLQTYFPIGSQSNMWIRLSDFRFGNRLKWMAILACYSLEANAVQSMTDKNVLPIGDVTQGFTNHLHLLLGCRTYAATTPDFGKTWVQKMNGAVFKPAKTVREAWYLTGKEMYEDIKRVGIFTNDLYFNVVGWNTTIEDKLNQYTNPTPQSDYIYSRDRLVYP